MFMVVSVNNLGLLWVAIEMTTLVSAFLVGFYRTKQSIEAAWKYIIICSVGIILALLGTIFFAYAMSVAGAPKSLNWTDLFAVAGRLDKNIVRIAFIFILVGYGTKAGLAPMHTWLPDAHSQAVAPISALLSGVLLKTALYAIIRFGLIVNRNLGGPEYFSHLMITFGLVSLGVAAGLILVQKDLKRLLAYSSIEHVGVICVGLGIGGPIATLGVLLHILNHAATKSLMFFGAGSIVAKYGRHNMRMIHGVMQSMPFTGTIFLAGTFALIGFPPFSIFMSELLIIIAGFSKGSYAVTSFLMFFLVLAFSGIIYQFSRMLFGRAPKGMPRLDEPVSAKMAYIFLLILIVGLGFTVPWILKDGIAAANEILKGI
jgi:hydrogenase-4 component F